MVHGYAENLLYLLFIWTQNLQTELEKTKVKYQELEKQKADAQSKLDELDKEVRMKDVFFLLMCCVLTDV